MAATCPNVNSAEWQSLLNRAGSTVADKIYRASNFDIPQGSKLESMIKAFTSQEEVLKNLSEADAYEIAYTALSRGDTVYDPQDKIYMDAITKEVMEKRVSDRVAEYKRDKGNTYNGDAQPFYGKKGTVLHKYFEVAGNSIINKKPLTRDQALEKVRSELQSHPDFVGEEASFYNINTTQYSRLFMAMQEIINDINAIQKTIDPTKEAKIFFELPIKDNYQSLGGTVDMLVLYSDATASVYDFKSYQKKKKAVPPHPKSVSDWIVQMGNYRKILKDNYGIRGFRHSRVIPVEVSFSKFDKLTETFTDQIIDGFQALNVQTSTTRKFNAHLNPIPLEEHTGSEKLDRLIDKLYSDKQRLEVNLQRATGKAFYNITKRLQRINKALEDIQLRRDAEGVLTDVRALIKDYDDRIVLTDTDELAMDFNDLLEARAELEIYNELHINFQDQVKSLEDKTERAALTTKLSNATTHVREMINRIEEEIIARFPENILEAGHAPGMLGSRFSGVAEWDIPLFQHFTKVWRVANENVRRETHKEYDKIIKVNEAFDAWANANGISSRDKFFKIYNPKTGNLYGEYTAEFWNKKREITKKANDGEALTQEEKDFMTEHFELDTERYNEFRTEFEKGIDLDVRLNILTEAEGKKHKNQFLRENDIATDQSNFFKSYNLRPKSTNKGFKTAEWQYIQQHKPLKDYYDMYIDYNIKFRNMLGNNEMGKRIGRHFVANIRQGPWEQMINLGPKNTKYIAEGIKQTFQIQQEDALYGARDPETGKPLSHIPLLYTDPVMQPLTKDRKEQIRAEIEQDVNFIYQKGTKEFEAEVKRRIFLEEKERGIAIKSPDLTKSLMLLTHSVLNHKHMTEIEGAVKAMRFLVENKKAADTVLDNQGNTMISKYTGELLTKLGFTQDTIQAFEIFTDRLVYGKQMNEELFKLGDYSSNKILNSLMNYFSVANIGANLILVGANFIQARTAFWMKAQENIHFDKLGIKSAWDAFAKRDPTYEMLAQYFEPTTRDILRERVELSGASLMARRATQRTIFLGHILGDENVDNSILYAMSKRYVVDSDGKIKNPKVKKDILDKNAKTVFESIVKDENGDVYIPGLSDEEFGNFRAKVQKQAHLIKGMLTPEQTGTYNSNMLLRMFTQFRTWSFGLAEERLGKIKYSHTMESFEMGRFRVGFGEIIGNGLGNNLKALSGIIADAALLGMYKTKGNPASAQRLFKKFIQQNPEHKGKINMEEFKAIYDGKLRALVAELRVYLILLALVQLLGGVDWDDDEEGNLFTWNAHQLVRRALLEVSFWWSPSSVTEIIRSPFPLFGLVGNMQRLVDNAVVETKYIVQGERNARDKTPPFYYTLKYTPVVNQALKVMNYFEQYNPPQSTWNKLIDWDEDDDED